MCQCLFGVARPHFDEGQVAPGYGVVRVQLNASARHGAPFIVKTSQREQESHPAVGRAGDWIQVNGLPSGRHPLFPRHAQILFLKLRRSNVARVQLSDHGQRQHAVRIHRHRSARLRQRLLPQYRVVAADGIVAVGVRTHRQVMGFEVTGAQALGQGLLGGVDVGSHGTHDALRHFFLHVKHVFKHPVVLFGP